MVETHMDMYLHDSSTKFCMVVRGELAGGCVRELEHAGHGGENPAFDSADDVAPWR
jgi:hypothetical protein